MDIAGPSKQSEPPAKRRLIDELFDDDDEDDVREDRNGGSEDLFHSFEERKEDRILEEPLDALGDRVKSLCTEGRTLNRRIIRNDLILKNILLTVKLKNQQEKPHVGTTKPISCSVQAKFLSSGRFLLLVKIANNSDDFTFQDWKVVVEWHTKIEHSDVDHPSSSKVFSRFIPLKHLSPDQNFFSEIISSRPSELPIRVSIFLLKTFRIPQLVESSEAEPKTLSISIGSETLSAWTLIQTRQSVTTVPIDFVLNSRRNPFMSESSASDYFSLRFSRSFVHLMCGGEYSCHRFLHWLLPPEIEISDSMIKENLKLTPFERDGDSLKCEDLTLIGFPWVELSVVLAKQSLPQLHIAATVSLRFTDQYSDSTYSKEEIMKLLREGLLTKISGVLDELRTCPSSQDVKLPELDEILLRYKSDTEDPSVLLSSLPIS